jgi:hypothetical protein
MNLFFLKTFYLKYFQEKSKNPLAVQEQQGGSNDLNILKEFIRRIIY